MTLKPTEDSQAVDQPPADNAKKAASTVISTGTVFATLLEALNHGTSRAEHERELALLQACIKELVQRELQQPNAELGARIDERVSALFQHERRKQRRRQLRIALLVLLILLCLLGAFIAGLLVGGHRPS